MGLLQGMLGNLSQLSAEELERDYRQYLTAGETITTGFKLVRDILIFTNHRIIDFDKQGATGKKMSVESISMDSIFEVSCETAGFGFDDSEITVHYIKSPYFKSNNIVVASKKYEFPKKFNIAPLYVELETVAQGNMRKLNV
jgi:hypothetical protein